MVVTWSDWSPLQIRALEKAKSSGNFSGMAQSEYEKDEDEDALEEEPVAVPGQSVLVDKGEPQRKKVKLWVENFVLCIRHNMIGAGMFFSIE